MTHGEGVRLSGKDLQRTIAIKGRPDFPDVSRRSSLQIVFISGLSGVIQTALESPLHIGRKGSMTLLRWAMARLTRQSPANLLPRSYWATTR